MKQRADSRLPPWLRVPFRGAGPRKEVRALLRNLDLHTVCESARCPNLCTCWERRTATFLLMGEICTRDCPFCAVTHAVPEVLDPDEPEHVARAAAELGLGFVVLTCVTRDDLADGGAAHLASTIRAVRSRLTKAGVEILPSDLQGNLEAATVILDAKPTVFNHNLETVARLTPRVRGRADYRRSLRLLNHAAEYGNGICVKSGIMLGMGETDDEIAAALKDLRGAGVRILTLGQYLPPSPRHWPLQRYVPPAEFDRWGHRAREEFGFDVVLSSPLVRSSFEAETAARQCLAAQPETPATRGKSMP